ncbi:MAG: TonB-dependent receptor plug domain-containing protein [Sphingobacteriaceae bacterium]
MNKKNIKVLAGLGFAHLVLLTGNAFSQEKISQLDEVVVTASRSPRKQSETGKVVRVISSEQLAQSQGRSLTELLNNVAGLTIGGNGINTGELKSLYLRGASAGNTLILIDGVAVNDASSASGEYDIAAIAIDQVERIEILKGGNSTLYGSDAVAGVINIITKKGAGKLTPGMLTTAGSYGTYKQALSLNGGLGKTQIAFNASHLTSKGISVAVPAAGSQNEFEKDEFKQQGLSLNIRQTINQQFKVQANIQANLNRSDLDAGAYVDAPDDYYKKNASLFGLGAQYIAGKAVMDINLSQNNVHNTFFGFGQLSKAEAKIANIEANVSYPLTNFVDMVGGLSYKRSETKQSSYSDFDGNNNLKSIYSSFFFKIGDRFRTELGGRFNEHSVYGTNLTYTFNPSYLIANRHKLFVNLSSAYKVPTLYQLFSEYGNLNLKPESTNTIEAGADLDLIANRLRLNLAYFDRNIKDVIDFDNGMYVNQNEQKDHGFELELNYKPHAKLYVDGFYAYVTGKQIQGNQSENNLYRRPKHSFGLNVGSTLGSRFTASLNFKWVGERVDNFYDAFLDQSVKATLKPYSLVDAYLQYKHKSNFTLFADVKNLFDTDYVEYSGYTTKGINFNAGFKWDIK